MHFPQPTVAREFLTGFAEIWRLWVPLLVLLICVGWATRRWWGGRLLLLSLVVIPVYVAHVALRERRIERETIDAWNKLRVPLPQATTIDGARFAAGTMVRWDQENAGHLLTAELGNGQEVVPGVVLTGDVDYWYDTWWRGNLARDTVLRGWNCAAGKIDIHKTGELRWCFLARPQKTPAGEIPAGTAISIDRPAPSNVVLHLPKIAMRAYPGDLWIGPDEWVALYEDGELLAVPGRLTRRGVTFEAGAVLRYGDEDVTRWYGYSDSIPSPLARPSGPVTGWRGNIGSSLQCEGGLTISAGRRVTIPASGDVVTTNHMDSSRPRSKPVMDLVHCELGPPP